MLYMVRMLAGKFKQKENQISSEVFFHACKKEVGVWLKEEENQNLLL